MERRKRKAQAMLWRRLYPEGCHWTQRDLLEGADRIYRCLACGYTYRWSTGGAKRAAPSIFAAYGPHEALSDPTDADFPCPRCGSANGDIYRVAAIEGLEAIGRALDLQEAAEREGTAAAWRRAWAAWPARSYSARYKCARRVLEGARKEDTIEAWQIAQEVAAAQFPYGFEQCECRAALARLQAAQPGRAKARA
jgi:rubredoxin